MGFNELFAASEFLFRGIRVDAYSGDGDWSFKWHEPLKKYATLPKLPCNAPQAKLEVLAALLVEVHLGSM